MPKRPTVTLICSLTGETFVKDRREYRRQLREGATHFYKDRATAAIARGQNRKLQPVTRECLQCGNSFEIIPKAKSSRFCSRKCQGIHSAESFKADEQKFEAFRQNAAEKSRKAWADGKFQGIIWENGEFRERIQPLESRECPICLNLFQCKPYKKQKTCLKVDCQREWNGRRARANPNCGGETNYRRYIYNGITMDSAWEVEIAQWMDAHKIEWKRSRTIMFNWIDPIGAKRRYYPDFYLPAFNIYLDPKNKYLMEKDRFKIEAVQRDHGITIIWGLRETILAYLESLLKTV